VSQSNPVRAVLGTVGVCSQSQQTVLFFSWQECFLIHLLHEDASKSLPQPGSGPTTTTYTFCLCEETATNTWASPPDAAAVSPCPRRPGEQGGPTGTKHSLLQLQPCPGHRWLLCSQGTATSGACCKLEVHVWKLGMLSHWQRHKRGWRRERGMEKSLMLF